MDNQRQRMSFILKIYILVENCTKYISTKMNVDQLDKIHFIFLLLINSFPGENQNFLATILSVDKTTAGRILLKLEELNLITRTLSKENKKNKIVMITPLGEKMIEKVMTIIDLYTFDIKQGMNKDIINKIGKALDTMVEKSTALLTRGV